MGAPIRAHIVIYFARALALMPTAQKLAFVYRLVLRHFRRQPRQPRSVKAAH